MDVRRIEEKGRDVCYLITGPPAHSVGWPDY